MGDCAPSFSAATIAAHAGGRLEGADVVIRAVGAIDDAGPDAITFIATPEWAQRWSASDAVAALVPDDLEVPGHDPARRALVRVPDAEVALIAVLELFAPPPVRPEPGVHPSAIVHADARVDPTARIGAHVSVARGCRIGAEVDLHPGVCLYPDVEIGDRSVVHATCVIRERCRLGERVCLHPGVLIGADGFGYRPAPDGSGLLKMPHLGSVEIGNDVEIGAGSCVDRGKFGPTVIGAGTKIDNLVQIGHNCRIGRHCLIAALTALAGSVRLGDGAMLGGQIAIAEHLNIGAGARVAGQSGVMHDVPAGQTWMGTPARPIRDRLRQHVALAKLPGLIQQIAKQQKGAARSPRDPDPA